MSNASVVTSPGSLFSDNATDSPTFTANEFGSSIFNNSLMTPVITHVHNITEIPVFTTNNTTDNPVLTSDNLTDSPVLTTNNITDSPVFTSDNLTDSPVFTTGNVTAGPAFTSDYLASSLFNTSRMSDAFGSSMFNTSAMTSPVTFADDITASPAFTSDEFNSSVFNASVITSSAIFFDNITANPTPAPAGLVSNAVRGVIEAFVDIGLCQIVSAIGVVTNTLIIVVFLKQGISDSVTVCLFTIALWDFTTCILSFFTRFYGIIRIFEPALGYTWKSVSTLILTTSQIYATYVSNCLGSYIAVERFICVTFPFQAQRILTTRRTIIANVTISAFVFCSFIYYQFSFIIVSDFNEAYNATVTFYTYSSFYHQYKDIIVSFRFSAATFYTNASFAISSFCAVVIMYRLKAAAKFRKNTGSTKSIETQEISSTERRVGVMLLTIILLYIVLALLPKTTSNIAHLAVPEYSGSGRYRNMFSVVTYFAYLSGLLNAAVNFFVLLDMNSTFSAAFYGLLSRKKA